MAICVLRHANVNKQATLLDGLDVSLLKWRVCGSCLNRFIHEGINHISNVKVRLKTPSGNVNINNRRQVKKNSVRIRVKAESHLLFCYIVKQNNGTASYAKKRLVLHVQTRGWLVINNSCMY